MTALDANRNTPQLGDGAAPELTAPVAAATHIFHGGLTAINSSGYAVPASADASLRVSGVAKEERDNSSGLAGALKVNIKEGVYWFKNSSGTDAISADDVLKVCYAVDDQTVALTSGEGSTIRPRAGTICGYDSSLGVAVAVGHFSQGIRIQKLEQVVEHSDLTAAATSQAVALGTLPAGAWVLDLEIYIETLFSGGSVSACTLDVGGTDTDAICDGHDVFTGAATGRLPASTKGVHPTGYFGGEAITATFASTSDNVVNLSAGKLTLTLPYIVF